MSTRTVGERVGAIESSKDGVVRLYGYGVYQGEQPLDRNDCLLPKGFSNPKILLDSGDVIWGCMCWWASEDRITEMTQGCEIVLVPVPTETLTNDDEK